jgi:hypothetical protein
MNDEGVEIDHTWNADNMRRFYPWNNCLAFANFQSPCNFIFAFTIRGLTLFFLTGEVLVKGCEVF